MKKIPGDQEDGSSSKKKFLIIGVIILLIALVPSIYFYLKYRQAVSSKPVLLEAQSVIKKVSQLIELPDNEEPTVATVSDKNKLQDQPFFTNAENGDKVLIYTQAKKAILYRPSINKIIDVAPIRSVQQTTPAVLPTVVPTTVGTKAGPTPSPTIALAKASPTSVSKKARVVLYNGTDTVGITYKVEKELLLKVENIEIIDKDNAAKSDYQGTIVVDLSSGKFKEKAAELATFLKGEIGALPEGETKPDADILVILAQ